MPKAQASLGEQMALPAVRHSLSWREEEAEEEEESAHVTPAGRRPSAAAKDDGDEAMAATIRRSSALVEGFMVWYGMVWLILLERICVGQHCFLGGNMRLLAVKF